MCRRAGAAPCRCTSANAHYQGAKTLGHGAGYQYSHDDPRGWVDQQYRPDEVADRRYYEPSRHGYEDEVRRRMSDLTTPADDEAGR